MVNMFGGGSPSYVATMPMAPAGYANGNNNNDNWENNPFVYLIWMWAFSMFGGWGNWGNGMGGGRGMGGFGSMTEGITAAQVDDIRMKVGEIASDVKCGNSGILSAANQIADQARLNGMQIADTKSALLNACCELQHNLSMQGCQFANQMQQCCCEIQNGIREVGCGVEKGLLEQTIQLNNNHCATMSAIQSQTNYINQGFAGVSAQLDRQTCALGQDIAATQRLIAQEGAATRQLMQDLHTQDLLSLKDAEINALRDRVQLTQSEQIAAVASQAAADRIISALRPASSSTTPAA